MRSRFGMTRPSEPILLVAGSEEMVVAGSVL